MEGPVDSSEFLTAEESSKTAQEAAWTVWYDEQKQKANEERSRRKMSLRPRKKGYIAPDTVFAYNGDPAFDEKSGCGHGILHFLSTKGNSAPWMNPSDIGAVRITTGPDEWRCSKNLICGNRRTISCSRGTPDPWFAFEFGVNLIPSHYSIRHGWCNGDGAMSDWILYSLSSNHEWIPIDRRHGEKALGCGGYAFGTWAIAPCAPARNFKLQMVGGHKQGRYYMYCSGFELYGTITSEADVDTSEWGILGSLDADIV